MEKKGYKVIEVLEETNLVDGSVYGNLEAEIALRDINLEGIIDVCGDLVDDYGYDYKNYKILQFTEKVEKVVIFDSFSNHLFLGKAVGIWCNKEYVGVLVEEENYYIAKRYYFEDVVSTADLKKVFEMAETTANKIAEIKV